MFVNNLYILVFNSFKLHNNSLYPSFTGYTRQLCQPRLLAHYLCHARPAVFSQSSADDIFCGTAHVAYV